MVCAVKGTERRELEAVERSFLPGVGGEKHLHPGKGAPLRQVSSTRLESLQKLDPVGKALALSSPPDTRTPSKQTTPRGPTPYLRDGNPSRGFPSSINNGEQAIQILEQPKGVTHARRHRKGGHTHDDAAAVDGTRTATQLRRAAKPKANEESMTC